MVVTKGLSLSVSQSVSRSVSQWKQRLKDGEIDRPKAKGALVERHFLVGKSVVSCQLCCDAAGFNGLRFCVEHVEYTRKPGEIHELADIRLQSVPGNVSSHLMGNFDAGNE